MSDLRKAAQQALEALEKMVDEVDDYFVTATAAIENLRAALAQPDEKKIGCVQHDCADCQARALAQPAAEPVAYAKTLMQLQRQLLESAQTWLRDPRLRRDECTSRKRNETTEEHGNRLSEWIQENEDLQQLLDDIDGCEEKAQERISDQAIQTKTAPPQRKPLTDEEINQIADSVVNRFGFACAIERAHGIGND